MKHRVFFVFILILAFAAASCSPDLVQVDSLPPETQVRIAQNLNNGRIPLPAEINEDRIPLAEDQCETFKNSIPLDWVQGTLEVPEDPSAPQGRKISIFYYGKLKRNVIPTLFINGGPTKDSHGYHNLFERAVERFRVQGHVAFVFFDQRGTGCSSPYPEFPPNPTEAQKNEILQRLTHYGSRGIVSDAEHIRRRLVGERKWNIFGHSYGGYVANRYMIMTPQALNASVAHGGVAQNDGFERTKNRIQSQVRILNEYLTRYPEDRVRLQRLRDYLTPGFCFENKTQTKKYCGHRVLSQLTEWLAFTNMWPQLHIWIEKLSPGYVDLESLKIFVSTFYFNDEIVNSQPSRARWAGAVISWSDRNVPPFNEFICRRIQSQVDLSSAYLNECAPFLQSTASTLERDPRPQSILRLPQDRLGLQDIQKSLQKNPQVQYYLYSGQQDGSVPVENFNDLLALIRGLPNVFYTNFPNSGHEGYRTESKIWQDLKSVSTSR